MKINSIIDAIKNEKKYNTSNSASWFQNKIKSNLNGTLIKSNDFIKSKQIDRVYRVLPGRMYTYVYSPKTKDKLPYYDTFPLVFPFSLTHDGFIGLNLHYLNYKSRLKLLERLVQLKTSGGKLQADHNYLKLSWRTLSNTSKFPEVAPCVKRYISTHIRSSVIEIPSTEWHIVSMLPTENFVGSSIMDVWSNSKARIR